MDRLPERIQNKILPEPNSGCWLWTASASLHGYGKTSFDGRPQQAHRIVFMCLRGPIPDGAFICHTCDNPSCVNPDHLYVGDAKTNVRDMMERERHWMHTDPERHRENARQVGLRNNWHRGANNPKAKLTTEQAAAIRASKEPTRFLVARYGVSRTTIQRIRQGTLWNK